MRRVSHLLPRALGQSEILRTARAQATLRSWDEIVGPGLASRSAPDRFDKGTVWVAVEGAAWAQELRMRKELILDRLQEQSGEPHLFTDIRFGVRPLPPKLPVQTSTFALRELPENDLSIREIAERRMAKWNDRGD